MAVKIVPEMKVLILDSGAGLLNPVIQSFQGVPGAALHVLTRDPECTARHSRFVKGVSPWPGGDGSARDLETIARVVKKTGAGILLPLDEPAIEFASAQKFSLASLAAMPPLPEPETLDRAGDKWKLSRFMAERGIPQPRTVLMQGQGVGELSAFPFPALIKKRKGSGGAGIRVFRTREEFLSFISAYREEAESHILQEYQGGGEIDCSLLALEGEILAHTVQRPLLAKTGYDFARAIEFVHDREALDLTARLIKELGYSGIAHVDMIRDHCSGELRILEINPRYWGSLMGSVMAGVNFPHLSLRQGLGLPLPPAVFRETRFATAREAARLLVRYPTGGNNPRVPLGRTNLRHYLADPLPLVVKGIKRFFRNKGAARI